MRLKVGTKVKYTNTLYSYGRRKIIKNGIGYVNRYNTCSNSLDIEVLDAIGKQYEFEFIKGNSYGSIIKR